MKVRNSLLVILFWFFTITTLIYLYQSTFHNFFFGDDFFNFNLVKDVDSAEGVFGFFNLLQAPAEFPFYRPLTTQLFYWLGKNLFGFQPFYYHIIMFFLFIDTLFLVYFLSKILTRNKNLSLLTVFFYSFSSSHFYRLNFLSQFQELGLTFFYILCLIFYILYRKKNKTIYYFLTLIFFILSITSKESAITIPLSILFIDFLFLNKNRNNLIRWLKNFLVRIMSFIVITISYIFLRFFYFGFSKGSEYQFILNLKQTINNILWYMMWSIGVPEHFVNFKIFKLSYGLNPSFLTEVGDYGALATLFFFGFVLLLLIALDFIINKKIKPQQRIIKVIIFSFLFIFTNLILVMFFPFHKFSYSVTLPLFGVSIMLALISLSLFKKSKVFFILILSIYLLANYYSLSYAYQSHWSIHRAKTSEKIYNYFLNNKRYLCENQNIYFYEFDKCPNDGYKAYITRELKHALIDDLAFKVFFNKNLNVYYQYRTSEASLDITNTNFIEASQFFSF